MPPNQIHEGHTQGFFDIGKYRGQAWIGFFLGNGGNDIKLRQRGFHCGKVRSEGLKFYFIRTSL